MDAAASGALGIAGRVLWACERSNGALTNGADAYGKTVWSWHPLLVSSRRRRCRPNRARQDLSSADDGATTIAAIIQTLKAEPGLAVFWASLLLIAAKHPTLAPMMAPLAAAPVVMTGWDTRQPLGMFLSAA